MKKLHRKGAVYPSPQTRADLLSFLPAALVTLAAALSPEDTEVLAYLISSSNNTKFIGSNTQNNNSRKKISRNSTAGGEFDHPPQFSCDCFRCYMSYWVRWDSSPNRQLIHEIIDAFEDGLAESKEGQGKKERKRRGGGQSKRSESSKNKSESCELESVGEGGGEELGGGENGSVRTLVSYIGERIWGVWGH